MTRILWKQCPGLLIFTHLHLGTDQPLVLSLE